MMRNNKVKTNIKLPTLVLNIMVTKHVFKNTLNRNENML